MCLSAIHGMVWHDLNGDRDHDTFVVGDEPDVVMTIDRSLSADSFQGFVGIAGKTAFSTSGPDDWEYVELMARLRDPVIIASPVEYEGQGSEPAVARISHVKDTWDDGTLATSFRLQVDEWDYLADQSHAWAEVNYLVIEAGRHQLDDGTIIEAGTVQVDMDGTWVSFEDAFGATRTTNGVTPVILTQVMSANGEDAVTARVSNASPAGFSVRLQEEKSPAPGHDGHPVETVGYVAISKPGDATDYGETLQADSTWTKFEYGKPSVSSTSSTLSYSADFGSQVPLIFAAMQTRDPNDTDYAAALRFANASATSVDLFIQEENSDSQNGGGAHDPETVGFLAILEGKIWTNMDSDPSLDTALEMEREACKAVNQKLIDQGFGHVADVAAVAYCASAAFTDMDGDPDNPPLSYYTQASTDQDMDGLDVLEGINAIDSTAPGTSFLAALELANSALSDANPVTGTTQAGLGRRDGNNDPISSNGNLLFMSDGWPDDPELPSIYASTLASLHEWADNIRAFGAGHGAVLEGTSTNAGLYDIDPNAQRSYTTYGLVQAMTSGIDPYNEGGLRYVEPLITGDYSIAGITVFLDTDNDGVLDPGETATMTDSSGFYSFTGLSAGTYNVRIVLPNNDWEQTAPINEVTQQPCANVVNVATDTEVYRINMGINYSDSVLDIDDESVMTNEDTPIMIDILDGDDHPQGTSLYFSRAEDPEHGTAIWNGSELVYTPDLDWNGEDEFEYAVTMGDGAYYTGTVTVTVSPVNDTPEILTDWFRIHKNEELAGTVAYDPDADMTAASFGTEYGTLVLNDNGTFAYTPDQDFVGIETFWINFTDSEGETTGDTEVTIFVCDVVEDTQETFTDMDLPHAAYVLSGPTLGTSTVTDAHGNLLIVGSPESNRAFIYRESSGSWAKEAELEGPYVYSSGVAFGSSVAIRDGIAVIGAMLDWEDGQNPSCQQGAVYVYEYGVGGWTLQSRLTPDMDTTEVGSHDFGFDYFGTAVALDEDGDTIVVGAPCYEYSRIEECFEGVSISISQSETGAAYVFEYDQGSWGFDQRLDPDDREAGARFGNSVAISYGTTVVGSYTKDECTGLGAGAAYVYKQATSSPYAWVQDRKLTALDGDKNDYFGFSVAVFDPDGDPDVVNEQVVVGAPYYDHSTASDIGAVYSFTLTGTRAYQREAAKYQLAEEAGFTLWGDALGWSVDIVNGLVAAGAPGRSPTTPGMDTGAAYLFDSTRAGDWQTDAVFTPSTQIGSEQFGTSVTISGSGLAVAAPGHDYTQDEAAVYFFPYNRTPAAEDMELVVAGASGTDYECGSVFGVDAFEGDSVTYSIVAATTGYQEHGTFSFEDPSHPEVVTYTPTSGHYPVSDKFQYKVTDGDGAEDIAEVTIYFGSPQILNRGIFYAGDFSNARDVSRQGHSSATAGADNIVTHPDGITGVIIDVAFPTDPEAFSPADFICSYVNASGNWETIVPEISVEVIHNLEVEGGGGSDPDYDCHRVRLTFPADTIKNWLEVTMDDSALGVSCDTFYFGYLWGDASGDGAVGSADLDLVRAWWGTGYTVPVPGDINADGDVLSADLDIVRSRWGSTVPAAPTRGMAMSSSSSLSSSRTTTPRWTAEADKVFEEYGIGDGDAENDLAIDEKFWEKLYKSLGLKW